MEISLPKGLEFPSYVDDLKEILLTVEPRMALIPEMRGHISRFVDGADMNLVYPNIYLGDCDAATNKPYLIKSGVTHVLNAAGNAKTGPAPVKTGADFYKDTAIVYKGLDLIDLPFANVAKHFEEAAEFIDSVLKDGGTVLVHCRQGRSRSATVLIAFLMTRRGYTAARALKQLRTCREVRPNNGFLTQIAALDLKLFREKLERHRMEPSSSSSDSSSESTTESTVENDDKTKLSNGANKLVSSSEESTASSTKRNEREDKSSDYDYQSAVESVRSSSLSSSSSKYESALSPSVSVSVSVELPVLCCGGRQGQENQSDFVSHCLHLTTHSDSSLESDNDADDESSDNEGSS